MKAQIDISEHVESATNQYLNNEGKILIEKAVEEYFNGQQFYSRRKTLSLLKISDPTLRMWERKGLITPVIVAGRACFTANEIERVINANFRYKRAV